MRVEEFIARYKVRYVYHFTSETNLPSIRRHGLLALQTMRSEGFNPLVAGGDDASRAADRRRGLDRFVHLCFVEDHPMAHLQKARMGRFRYVAVQSDVLALGGVLGCTGLANAESSKLVPIEALLDEISLAALYGGPGCSSVKEPWERYDRARRAEILVPEGVPLRYLRNV